MSRYLSDSPKLPEYALVLLEDMIPSDPPLPSLVRSFSNETNSEKNYQVYGESFHDTKSSENLIQGLSEELNQTLNDAHTQVSQDLRAHGQQNAVDSGRIIYQEKNELTSVETTQNEQQNHNLPTSLITSSNSPIPEKIMIKFGNQLVEKGSEKYYTLLERSRETLKRHREKNKIEKEIQEKLKKLANNLDTLKSMNEKIFTTYPNAKEQLAILYQRFINLKAEVDSSELITTFEA
ncbi:unnamed protein product [Brachionus calyciflorus]|uniref:Uncharacterized protein n=1 Tax=Brachionus calyciflorus TaxID=104777 RepID=A0A813VKC4_9BILA|nr:unnamed protein product [Brachionus calyciflorus]